MRKIAILLALTVSATSAALAQPNQPPLPDILTAVAVGRSIRTA